MNFVGVAVTVLLTTISGYVLGLCTTLALALIVAFPVMWLWSLALVPLGLPAIGYWGAWSILVLAYFVRGFTPSST